MCWRSSNSMSSLVRLGLRMPLGDPKILRFCLSGCQSITLLNDNFYYHGLYGSTSCCKANNQSNGKGQISTSRGSKIPQRILMKPRMYNYVAGMTTHANPCGTATTWVVSANTWHVTCFGFLDDLFSFFLYSWDHATPSPLDWLWLSIRHMACFHARMCLLGVPLLPLTI